MWKKYASLVLGAGVLASAGCGHASGDPTTAVTYPFVLTAEEVREARVLAEADWPSGNLASGPRPVFIKVDLLPDSQAETTHRLVMVHHYAYPGDQTIFTMVDLNLHEVVQREIRAHYPTALAHIEVEKAIQIARQDEGLHMLLRDPAVRVDARPIEFAPATHPLFGHRMVHLLLRQHGDTLLSPLVYVDLTTQTVHVETPPVETPPVGASPVETSPAK